MLRSKLAISKPNIVIELNRTIKTFTDQVIFICRDVNICSKLNSKAKNQVKYASFAP